MFGCVHVCLQYVVHCTLLGTVYVCMWVWVWGWGWEWVGVRGWVCVCLCMWVWVFAVPNCVSVL